MADDDPQQTLVVNGNVDISSNISDIDTFNSLLPGKDMKNATTADILQQALSEAEGYEQNVTFNQVNSGIVHDRIQHLTDHSYINTTSSSNFISDSEIVSSQDIDSVDGSIENGNISSSYLHSLPRSDGNDTTCLTATSHVNKNIFTDTNLSNETLGTLNCIANSKDADVLSNVAFGDNTSQICTENTSTIQAPFTESKADNSQYTSQANRTTSSDSLNLTHLKIPSKQSTGPLGSLNNPIQIIQHGNSYHSTQTLTQAQLQQITHVLQRQHAKKGFQNGAKSVLYDSSTNTRIVCRVVHPSELQKKNIEQETSAKTTLEQAANAGRGRGRPRKIGAKRLDDEDKANSLLSKEEREEKKKHRPRTRSGRISKPPSYMVKDYKRIHHLDFNEEPYDDSDGGYSDYNVSDEEGGKRLNKGGTLPPGVTTAKKRSYSCSSCSKAYIGRGGLSRHYRLNPRHGSMPEGEDVSTQDENSNSSLASSILSSSGCNSQSNAAIASQPTKVNSEISTSLLNQVASTDFISSKRKAHLQEILKNYPDNEVIDAVLPKVASDVSLWDFFVTKCDQEKSNGPEIFTMLRQFEVFLIELRKMSQQSLCPASLEDKNKGKMIINISSKEIASSLSLETGAYFVTEPPLLAEDNNMSHDCISTNATASMAATDNLISPPLKRKRIISNVENVSASLPDQILNDIVQEGDSLEMPLTTDSFVESSELHEQESSLLGSTLCNIDSHHMNSKSLFDLNNSAMNASTLVQLTSNSTTVTPSSLSSGCLSAVDTSETQRTHNFNAPSPSIQVRKVQLYGSQQHLQHLLLRDESATSINTYNLIPENNLSMLPTHSQVDIKDPSQEPIQVSLCNSDIINRSSYSSLPLDTNIDIFSSFSNQELQPKTLILDNSRTPSSTIASVSLLRTNNIQNQSFCDSHDVNVQKGFAQSITDCLPIANEGNQTITNIVASDGMESCVQQMELNDGNEEKGNVFQEETHSEIATTTAKPPDGPVLKSLMMPDGQIIGLWSSSDSTDLKSFSEQSVQNYLPGNLIIVQNSDGSIQVPSELEGVPLETLQALISMNSGLISQVGAQNDAPV